MAERNPSTLVVNSEEVSALGQSIVRGKRQLFPVGEARQCRECNKVRPVTDFGSYKKARLGRKATCKECHGKRLAMRERLRKEKACFVCKQPFLPLDRRTLCLTCSADSSTKSRRQLIARRERGLCSSCGAVPPEHDRFSCRPCLEAMKETAMRIRRERKEAGLCVSCGGEPFSGRRHMQARPNTSHDPMCRGCYIDKAAGAALGSRSKGQLLAERFEEQGGRCPYTGDVLIIGVNASIDHILPISRFPERARDVANVEWVRYDVNIMKRNFTKAEFLEIISSIVAFAVKN